MAATGRQQRRSGSQNHKRWKLGSNLLCWGLAIIFSQLIIHPLLRPWSSIDSTTESTATATTTEQLVEHQPHPQTSSRRTQQVQQPSSTKRPDGYFNNIPIYYNNGSATPSRYSTVHCVGETHHLETAWMYRSCHYTHFCFDTNSSDFVILRSPAEKIFSEQQQQQQPMASTNGGIYISTTLSIPTNLHIALGGINPRWMSKGKDMGIHKVKWSPQVIDLPSSDHLSFFELPDHVVLIPFHSFAAHNIGHLLWDDFLPIYTLLSMFDLMNDDNNSDSNNNHVLPDQQQLQQQQPYQYLVLRKVLKHAMYASCEKRPRHERECKSNFERLLPIMGIDPKTYGTTKHYKLKLESTKNPKPQSSLVCAKQGVAGIGMLTDHGFVDHGWLYSDMKHPHNYGRGPMLAKFRKYLIQNLGLSETSHKRRALPFQIVISTNSSRNKERQLLFQDQMEAIQQSFSSDDVLVKNVTLAQMSLQGQVQMALQTSVFITACGGGAVTAMFLPKGATLIVFYPERGGLYFPTLNYTGTPAFLDWDLLNNLAQVRVHWFPIGTMNSKESIETLVHLLRQELHTLKASMVS